MPDLRVPPLAEPYHTALDQALRFALARFEPIGIIVSGTIVRGNPSPSSDLDIFVIHREPWRQRLQRFFNGVPAELFINPPAQVERYFDKEIVDGRPITAHMLATGEVVYSADQLVDELRARAAALLAAPPRADAARIMALAYAAVSQLEDALDVLARDRATAQLFLARAVDTALALRFWQAGRWQPRAKELLSELDEFDAALADEARGFLIGVDISERVELARRIVQATADATGFFEWESDPD